MKSSPCSQLCDLMSNSYRNRCLWNVRVTITFIREIEVYRMCTFCLKPMVSGHSHTSRMPVQCQNCHHVNSVKKISWKCVCLVDDGTGEAYMCFDGQYALKLIQCSLVNSSNLCTCSDGESKNISFHEIQQLIEKIVCKYFLHLKSQDVYSLLSTSFEMNSSFSRHLSNDIPMCICQRYESFSSLLSSSLHNFSSDLLLQLLYLLHDVIRLCYSSTSYEILIKLIHSKTSTLKKMQDEEKMNSSHQRCEKTIVIQKLNDPYWSIDNIDICSESFEQLRLQCYDLKVLKNAELSTIAWQILQEIN